MSLRGSETTEPSHKGLIFQRLPRSPASRAGSLAMPERELGQHLRGEGLGGGIFIVRAGAKPVPGKLL